MSRKIAFISYETPYAPGGGVAAVISRLPVHVAKASGYPTLVITPFHYEISKTASLQVQMKKIGRVSVPFQKNLIGVNVLQIERNGTWCFLQAEDKRFFAGIRHPYDVRGKKNEVSALLLRDSLLFGAAAARSLPLLGVESEWILMMQDWEAATMILSLTATDSGPNFKGFLTIHNSYDSGAKDEDLLRFGIDPRICPGSTILQRALPLVQMPVFTVSDQFALDFSEEVWQTEVIAPHLKNTLPPKLIGVNNGVFTDLAIDQEVFREAKHGNFEPLMKWKLENRELALKALDEFQPARDKPLWGDLKKFKRDEAVWFVMAGRDDPRQKGYDVACSAITTFLTQGGEARFLFFPIPGDEGLKGLAFLQKLAQRFPESVLVLPFISQEGYYAALQGATYGIMPSLYEPFGMANEFYLKGTVGIGRATGGILQQIVPLRSASSFSHAVQVRSDRRYGASALPTGILFRERDNLPSMISDWQGINAARYKIGDGSPDRVEQRSSYTLFRAMAAELRNSIADGIKIYSEQPDLYFQMLVEGIRYIQRTFSWERAAQVYVRYMDDEE